MREKKPINIQIGNEIRIAREQAQLTQAEFGELIALGTKNISDIERGVTGIKVSTLKRICEKLPISSDTLLFGTQSKNDIGYLSEKLKRLSPKKFAAVKELLNKLFYVFALLKNSSFDHYYAKIS